MGMAASVAPGVLGFQNPIKKLVHFIYLLGQILSQNNVFASLNPPQNMAHEVGDRGFVAESL